MTVRDARDDGPAEPASVAPTTSATPRRTLGVDVESGWRWAYAVGLMTVLVVGFVANLANPAARRIPEAPLLDGSWAEAYQRAFDAESPLLAPARTLWGVIDTQVFGQGRAGVLVGRDGWLFSREEYATVADADAAIAVWADRIALVRDELAEHGATLVVALVPSKASVLPDYVPAPLPSAAATRYDALLAALAARDVPTTDLRPTLSREPDAFLRTDTHWSPSGAAAAALRIAEAVRSEAPFEALDGTAYRTEHDPATERYGDLTTFLDLGPFLEALGPTPDLVRVPRTVSLAPASDDLFATVDVPVVLVGTSYSADPAWNLVGALREALGSDVLDAAESGLGAWEPMLRYLGGAALRSTPPEVVVWEIPERYVTLEGHVPEAAAW